MSILKVFFASLFFVVFVTPLQADNLTISGAINKAGRQRMLSQRVLRLYCESGLDPADQNAALELKKAVKLFDTQLRQLNAFSPTVEIQEGLLTVSGLWVPVKRIVDSRPNRGGAEKLLRSNDELLAAANWVVDLLEQHAGTAKGKLVNISGRQRMLSQRTAKFFMLHQWNVGNEDLLQLQNQAAQEFTQALGLLMASPLNTDFINTELAKVEKLWRRYEGNLNMTTGAGSEAVSSSSDKILAAMETITQHYENLPDS